MGRIPRKSAILVRLAAIGLATLILGLGCLPDPPVPRFTPPPGAPPPPSTPAKLIFIHHSVGANWLSDDDGGLGQALADNGYFVSDTHYGWGPPCPECRGCDAEAVGSCTDIGHWWAWFLGERSDRYLEALFTESNRHVPYTRLAEDPGGENEIIMFKSCYPNSALKSGLEYPVGDPNPLWGEPSGSEYHTLENAKALYTELLPAFAEHPDKLFIIITAPPLVEAQTRREHAANARALNRWLVGEWLDGYPLANVAVFDFYNVLTSNGGSPYRDDLGRERGNHHRWWNGAVQHLQTYAQDVAAYGRSDQDSHPNRAGNQKATAEFVPVLNFAYQRWQAERPGQMAGQD